MHSVEIRLVFKIILNRCQKPVYTSFDTWNPHLCFISVTGRAVFCNFAFVYVCSCKFQSTWWRDDVNRMSQPYLFSVSLSNIFCKASTPSYSGDRIEDSTWKTKLRSREAEASSVAQTWSALSHTFVTFGRSCWDQSSWISLQKNYLLD